MEITIGGVLNQEDRPKCKGLHLTREQIGVCQKVAEELMKRNIPFHFEAVKEGALFAGITIHDRKSGEFATIKLDPDVSQNIIKSGESIPSILEGILKNILVDRLGVKNPEQKDIKEHFSQIRQKICEEPTNFSFRYVVEVSQYIVNEKPRNDLFYRKLDSGYAIYFISMPYDKSGSASLLTKVMASEFELTQNLLNFKVEEGVRVALQLHPISTVLNQDTKCFRLSSFEIAGAILDPGQGILKKICKEAEIGEVYYSIHDQSCVAFSTEKELLYETIEMLEMVYEAERGAYPTEQGTTALRTWNEVFYYNMQKDTIEKIKGDSGEKL